MSDENGADVSLKLAGQEVNLRNVKSLNTIATLITMFGVCVLGVFLYFHEAGAQQDKVKVADVLEKSDARIAAVLKEQNTAQKQQTEAIVNAINKLEQRATEIACLSDPSMKNRPDARDFCRRISRDR